MKEGFAQFDILEIAQHKQNPSIFNEKWMDF